MSVSISNLRCLTIFTAASIAVLLTSCDSSVKNAAPRVTAIPSQSTTSGSTFSLDLSKYVKDREAGTLTYAVTSGGGSFAAATYSNTFPVYGEHTVSVKITDPGGKTATATFKVKVTQSTIVVLKAGTSLVGVDDGSVGKAGHTTVDTVLGYTDSVLNVSGAQGFADVFKVALARGCMVYERTVGSQKDLYLYDPYLKTTKQLGSEPSQTDNEVYLGKTSDNKVVFQSGPTADTAIYLYNAITGMTRLISDQQNQLDGNAFVSSTDEIYYERGASGQADIYVYDPDTDTSTAVSTDVKNETILAVLPNGAVVFTRKGPNNENDLYYWKNGVGVIEIGADLGLTAQGENKSYGAYTSDSKIVFTHMSGGTNGNIYLWNPSTAISQTVSNNANGETFNAVTSSDKVVYTRDNSGNDDIYLFNPPTSTTTVIANDAANETYQSKTSKGDVVYTRENGSGDGIYMWDDSASTLRTLGAPGSSDFTFRAALKNGDVTYSNPTSGVWVWDESGASATNVGDNTHSYAGEVGTVGKFVVSRTVASQEDLYFWNGTALVAISSDSNDEGFLWSLSSDRLLFRRKGGTTYDVYYWDSAAPTTVTRISNTTLSHTAVSSFTANY